MSGSLVNAFTTYVCGSEVLSVEKNVSLDNRETTISVRLISIIQRDLMRSLYLSMLP